MKAFILGLFLASIYSCTGVQGIHSPATEIITKENILFGSPALTKDGLLNLLIEIPAGTQQKWEAMKSGKGLKWDRKDGELRIINYLPYPGNYGMVPRTLLPYSDGGDGDPLDVLLLGRGVQRASIVAVKPIGVLRLLDDNQQDDKIIAVPLTGPLSNIDSLVELNERYPGAATIIETWFLNYKGPGRMKSKGYDDVKTARKMIDIASKAFETAYPNSQAF
jgi:inorganic pyrophosphatase